MAEMMQPEMMQGQPAPQPGQPAQQTQGGDSPLLKVMKAAGRIMYINPTSDKVIEMLRKGKPLDGLVWACLFILHTVQSESGNRIPTQVVMQAAAPVLALLAELAAAAGVELTPEIAEQAQQFVMQQLQKAGRGEQPQAPQAPAPAEEEQAQPPADEEQAQQPGLIAEAMA